ncbi:MAG TPA: amidohydrolase family protein [Firmicutes bacterium]|nr:amidohydrolase family protein [Bacillota bacterium]
MEIIDSNVLFGFWPRRRVDSSLDTVKRIARDHGVSKIVVCCMRGIFDDFVQGNSEAIEASKCDDTVIPAATINPNRFLDCESEMDRCLESGVKLFRFFPEFQGWTYSYRPFLKLLQRLAGAGAIAMLPTRIGRHLEFGSITEIGRAVAETGARCILTDVYYGNLAEALTVASERPGIAIESHLLNSPDAIELVVNTLGPDRLIFGSGSPLKYIDSALLPVMGAACDDTTRHAILSGNMLKMLG